MLPRTVAFFTLALVASTWRLWTPQQAFPQVPLLGWLVHIPLWVDWIAGGVLLIALGLTIIQRPSSRGSSLSLAVAVVSMLLLMALDQHRLQPWAYLFVLLGCLIAVCPGPEAVRWARWILISVYVYSAVSKLDQSFVATIGADFVETGFKLVGVSASNWPDGVRTLTALALPVGEFVVALGLIVPRLRVVGVVLGLLTHVTLIVVLGPWGMNHKLGVLIWNLKFCVLLVLLFWPRVDQNDGNEAASSAPATRFDLPLYIARAVAVAALLLPLTEPLQIWDHWPSWGLYSTRAARVDLYLADEFISDLPEEFQRFFGDEVYSGYLRKLAIDRWSLDALDAPLYPQDRFQFGVALSVLQRHSFDREAVAIHRSPPHRFTGERVTQRYTGLEAIRAATGRFWLNTQARS